MSESYYIEDNFNNQFFIAGEWIALAPGNFGAPPIAYQVSQNYNQHGEKVLGYTLTPRIIALELYSPSAEDESDYFRKRADLLKFLRPDRAPFEFVVTRDNGDIFSLDVRPDTGLLFEPQPPEDGRPEHIDVVLTLVAHYPIWLRKDVTISSPAAISDDNTPVPTPIPTLIGLGGNLYTTGALTYNGTWETYPIITLTGAYTLAIITNTFNGVTIIMNAVIAGGVKRILTLDPNNLSIVDGDGVSKITELGQDSNLLDFTILPTEVKNGVAQAIDVRLEASDGSSAFKLEYNERYYGI